MKWSDWLVRYVGIDPSLSGTGLVILDETGDIIEAVSLKAGKEDDPLRFMKLTERIMKYLNPATDKVLIEGFSFGSRGKGVSTMYGIGWCIRIYMQMSSISWQEVAPTALKKFASNKGNAKKEDLVLPVYKKWGFESSSNDITDGFVMAKMAWSMYNPENLLTYEKEVLSKIKKV
jgi:crossover junction endodeoxyribonuclease RuvC